MVQHMNDDHVEAMQRYCLNAGLALPEAVTPVMTGIDAEGFHLRLGGCAHRALRVSLAGAKPYGSTPSPGGDGASVVGPPD